MICRFCPAGKRIRRNDHWCVQCLLYGIIVRDDHECKRDGWKDFDRIYRFGDRFGEKAGLSEDGGRIIELLPGILSESGKREEIPGMDE